MEPSKSGRHYTSGMVAAVPVIRGTRVPLQDLIDHLESGRGLEAFRAEHPEVTSAQLNRAIILGLQALAERRKEAVALGGGESKPEPPAGPAGGNPGAE